VIGEETEEERLQNESVLSWLVEHSCQMRYVFSNVLIPLNLLLQNQNPFLLKLNSYFSFLYRFPFPR